MEEQRKQGKSPRRLPVPPGGAKSSPSPSPLGTPGTPSTSTTPSESKSTPRRHLPAPPSAGTISAGGTPSSPRVRRRLAKTNGGSPLPAELEAGAASEGSESPPIAEPAVVPQEAGRKSVLAWMRSRDAHGVRAPEPKYLVVGEKTILDTVAEICRERAEEQIPVSWTNINIQLMEAFGNTTIMTYVYKQQLHTRMQALCSTVLPPFCRI